MTSPTSVGQVSVEIVASARALAKSLKSEVEKAFKDLDFSKAIRDATGNQKIKLPVAPVVDTDSIGEKVRRTRVPKVPVELDPITAAFQRSVKAQVTTLSRQSLKIPLDADGGRLRAQISAELASIQAQAKLKVSTEPGAKAEYETKLKAQLAEVSARVKQHVNVEVDVDKGSGASGALGAIGSALKGFSKGLPNIGGIASGIADLGGALQKAAGSSAQLGGNLTGAFTSATGPIGLVIGLLVTAAAAAAALAGAVTLVVPAMSAVAGAAAAIPAALVGVGAVFGTLALGFKGISEAFGPKSGGGGGGGSGQDPAAKARQIAAAERGVEGARRGIAASSRSLTSAERGYQQSLQGVTEAQKRAAAAQLAVNKARVEAKEDIEDLGRALRGAVLDEESATLGVTEALRELNAVKLTGVLPDIQRADLAYRQAQLTLENATDSAGDLGEEQADSAKKGVEGSDKVVAALESQAQAQQGVRDAQDGVIAAQDSLASAQDGVKSSTDALISAQDSLASAQAKVASGGGGAAAAVTKLAPAARKFVDAIKGLKPAFEDLRLDVQQRLFEGLDKTVTKLGKAWIPALRTTLGSYADTFNQFFKSLGSSLVQPKFIADIQAGAEGARQGLDKVGASITTSLVPAFGALSRAAGPFLSQLGTEIADVVTEFSNWVLQAEKTDGLKGFFATATESMHDLFTTGKLVGKIVGDLFAILTGTSLAKGEKTPLDSFNAQLEKVHKFLSDPTNKAEIQGYFDKIKAAIESVTADFQKIDGWITQIDDFQKKLFGDDNETKADTAGQEIGTALVQGILAGIIAGIALNFTSFGPLLWEGENSLIGRIKSGLGISSPSTLTTAMGKELINGLIKGMGDRIEALKQRARELPNRIREGIGNAAGALYQKGKDFVAGLGNGIAALYGTIKVRASGLKTQITGALSNAGSALFNHGYNFVIGLYNGIASLGGWLYNRVANFVRNNIVQPVTSFLHINSPSKLAAELGARVPQGLALGILGGAGQVAAAAEKMAAAALPSLGDASFGMDLSAATVQGSLSKANTWEASWAPGMTGDKILDAMRGMIKFKHGGSVDRALSTA